MLARLTTIITSISAVSLPVGSFIGGILVKNIGIDFTLVIGGGLFIIASLISFYQNHIDYYHKSKKLNINICLKVRKFKNNIVNL
ncbi:hypothetical protein AOB58_2767 (plasmid) [Staphylococcus sp. AntiMn-1]|uniref:hypothetical protein n=1 Tax=Staphylococcus sp. AntiMn-1 TaxID=1715860 RepID=UPI0007F0742C|nr:hypothetical protein [Staphylococcus sp. AntiMn-1]ANK39486.1 hypothetical protein AOB58_2767 [Staphylococcus sp. AntiMn-1]